RSRSSCRRGCGRASALHPPAAFFLFFFFYSYGVHPALHSFPTRRSSDLPQNFWAWFLLGVCHDRLTQYEEAAACYSTSIALNGRDRKSTRLNSSHEWISYAVFCLKKKKKSKSLNACPSHHNKRP